MEHRERIREMDDVLGQMRRIVAAFEELSFDERAFWLWFHEAVHSGKSLSEMALIEAAEMAETAAGIIYIEDTEEEIKFQTTTVF